MRTGNQAGKNAEAGRQAGKSRQAARRQAKADRQLSKAGRGASKEAVEQAGSQGLTSRTRWPWWVGRCLAWRLGYHP